MEDDFIDGKECSENEIEINGNNRTKRVKRKMDHSSSNNTCK